ncbi:MAG: tail fiber protein [Gallionellaceae bacterium]|nr:tail fiber protein [Gallionellaceae bacterium]
MRNNSSRMAAALALSSGFLFAAEATACSSEPFIGSICITASTFCPSPLYLPANGATLPINQYSPLFALIGTTYGGNGTTNFMLPNLNGRVPVGAGAGLSPVILGQTRGAESTTLLQSNLPAAAPLTVTVAVNSDPGTATSPAGGNARLGASAAGGPSSATMWSAAAANPVNMAGVSVSGGLSGGGSVPIATLPPELGVNYCIAVQGLFPSRP